jgi:hypothetical protein
MTKLTRVRKNRRDGRYWDDRTKNPRSLGCSTCVDFALCGGIHTSSGAFDCLTYCCLTPTSCSTVCPRNSDFINRMLEVGGFELEQVARVPIKPFPSLPVSVPLIYARGARQLPFSPGHAGIPLYQLIDRKKARLRFETRAQLLNYFGLHESTSLVASGTDKDPPLERWWGMSSARIDVLKQLIEIGIVAATSPNFSVFSDVPRWDNFHAMKRIAICWQEMLDAGLPSALHVNARSPRDWERWTAFVRSHEEVDAIAYEFATGSATRLSYHVDELRHLADRVPRPLTLVVRGALSELKALRASFREVTLLDTTTYMRTVNRKMAVVRENAAPAWRNAPTRPSVDLDELILHNHRAMLATVQGDLRRSLGPGPSEAG